MEQYNREEIMSSLSSEQIKAFFSDIIEYDEDLIGDCSCVDGNCCQSKN